MKFWGNFLFVILLFFSSSMSAQAPASFSSADIYQRISKLKVLGSVLYVAAHPDDENTRLIAWLSNDRLYRTGYLSLTRGDGGQNLIGDEQGIELGLIRTQELLAARRIDGGEQFFSRAFDFGYSKSTEEALRIWDREKTLADAVWVIRKFQPDVIITRFPPDNRAGHGHHSASAVIAHEAFKAAGDPERFKEQFKYGVTTWKPKRIFWNAYNFGADYTSDDQMKIDVGGFNQLIGKSYGEIAADSRSQHKSQGFGVPSSRGTQLEYFEFTDGERATRDIMEGVEAGWRRVGQPAVAALIDQILQQYKINDPGASVKALTTLYARISTIPDNYWKTVKLAELKEIIAAASGLWMEAFTTAPRAVRDSSLNVQFAINNRDGATVLIKQVLLQEFDSLINWQAKPNMNLNFSKPLPVGRSVPLSQPYWLVNKMNSGSFNVTDQTLIGKPQSEHPFIAKFVVNVEGKEFVYERPVWHKNTDPVKGEIYQPLIVVPPPSDAGSVGRLRRIDYEHIPAIHYFNSDTSTISLTGVKIAGSKIGYIAGAGDKVPEALRLMGYDVTFLTDKDLVPRYLSEFDAIITGVRAYNVHGYLARNAALENYVSNGGNLIVQYNTNNFVGPLSGGIGPVPFRISRQRITDENSPVTFALPDHPVLNFPNKITPDDFNNWVQERGIYFAEEYDKSFEAPLAMRDPGESDTRGSLIIANHGKGKFVYTGLVFFRQLPAGVTGAYRLLANIIALNQRPE